MKIKILDKTRTTCLREADKRNKFDEGDILIEHDVQGFHPSTDYYDLDIAFTPKPNIPYYLLYALFSMSDSFSTDEGQIEFITLTESREVAEVNKKILQHNSNDKQVLLFDDDFKMFKTRVPWDGYFEKLTCIIIKEVYYEIQNR